MGNLMTSLSMSICFGPNMYRCRDDLSGLKEQGLLNNVLKELLDNYEEIFTPVSNCRPFGGLAEMTKFGHLQPYSDVNVMKASLAKITIQIATRELYRM